MQKWSEVAPGLFNSGARSPRRGNAFLAEINREFGRVSRDVSIMQAQFFPSTFIWSVVTSVFSVSLRLPDYEHRRDINRYSKNERRPLSRLPVWI